MPPKSFKPTRERKQRRRDRNAQDAADQAADHAADDGVPAASKPAAVDSNAEMIVPLTTAEKAEKRRQQLKEELKAGMPKMSAKKQKRFNKYVETKLKKEQTVAILEKLAETQVDISLFTSTRSIGVSRESKKMQIKRALLEEQAGINMEQNKDILYEERRPVNMEVSDDESADEKMTDAPAAAAVDPQPTIQPTQNPFTIGVVVGSGLKRSLDGEGGPVIIKRIKKNRKPRRVPVVVEQPEESSDEEMPTSDEEGEAITFCGHPRRPGSSYCTPHFHLSRGPGTPSERTACAVLLRLVETA